MTILVWAETILMLRKGRRPGQAEGLGKWLCPIARQAPLSMGFSRQEYWHGLQCPAPEDLPNPGMELASLPSPALVT